MLTSSESVSNLSDTESMKKNRRELRLGDRVLVRTTVFKPTITVGFRLSNCHIVYLKKKTKKKTDWTQTHTEGRQVDSGDKKLTGITADKVLTEVKTNR